jgi:YD repeat-containing protein
MGDPDNTLAADVKWLINGTADAATTIHRRQTHNAFGEVDSETDGRGNTTNLVYNTLGLLTAKIEPTVQYTLANG